MGIQYCRPQLLLLPVVMEQSEWTICLLKLLLSSQHCSHCFHMHCLQIFRFKSKTSRSSEFSVFMFVKSLTFVGSEDYSFCFCMAYVTKVNIINDWLRENEWFRSLPAVFNLLWHDISSVEKPHSCFICIKTKNLHKTNKILIWKSRLMMNFKTTKITQLQYR